MLTVEKRIVPPSEPFASSRCRGLLLQGSLREEKGAYLVDLEMRAQRNAEVCCLKLGSYRGGFLTFTLARALVSEKRFAKT